MCGVGLGGWRSMGMICGGVRGVGPRWRLFLALGGGRPPPLGGGCVVSAGFPGIGHDVANLCGEVEPLYHGVGLFAPVGCGLAVGAANAVSFPRGNLYHRFVVVKATGRKAHDLHRSYRSRHSTSPFLPCSEGARPSSGVSGDTRPDGGVSRTRCTGRGRPDRRRGPSARGHGSGVSVSRVPALRQGGWRPPGRGRVSMWRRKGA